MKNVFSLWQYELHGVGNLKKLAEFFWSCHINEFPDAPSLGHIFCKNTIKGDLFGKKKLILADAIAFFFYLFSPILSKHDETVVVFIFVVSRSCPKALFFF